MTSPSWSATSLALPVCRSRQLTLMTSVAGSVSTRSGSAWHRLALACDRQLAARRRHGRSGLRERLEQRHPAGHADLSRRPHFATDEDALALVLLDVDTHLRVADVAVHQHLTDLLLRGAQRHATDGNPPKQRERDEPVSVDAIHAGQSVGVEDGDSQLVLRADLVVRLHLRRDGLDWLRRRRLRRLRAGGAVGLQEEAG